MTIRRAIASALLALAVVPGASAAPPAVDEATAQPRPAALALARVLNSEAAIVGDEKDDRKAAELMQQLASGDREIAVLEKSHPGLLRAMAAAMLPIVNRSARERLPELWRRQAMLYGASFTDTELAALTGFYASATGQKLVQGVADALQPRATLAEMKASPDFRFSVDALQQDKRAAAVEVAATLDAGDRLTLAMLAKTGLLDRMKAMAPRTQAIALRWYEEEAPWEAEATAAAIAAVMTRFGIGDDE